MASKSSGRSVNIKSEGSVKIEARSVNVGVNTAQRNVPADPVVGNSVSRLRELRNDLGYACSELEQTLVQLGAVTACDYGNNRNTPQPAADADQSMLSVMGELQSEAQSVYGRFTDFVYGEDRGEDDTDDSEGDDADSKPSKVAAETTSFGNRFKTKADGTCLHFANIRHCVNLLEDSLLSRPSQGELGAEGSAKEVRPESVIEMYEHVERMTVVTCDKIHALNAALRTTF